MQSLRRFASALSTKYRLVPWGIPWVRCLGCSVGFRERIDFGQRYQMGMTAHWQGIWEAPLSWSGRKKLIMIMQSQNIGDDLLIVGTQSHPTVQACSWSWAKRQFVKIRNSGRCLLGRKEALKLCSSSQSSRVAAALVHELIHSPPTAISFPQSCSSCLSSHVDESSTVLLLGMYVWIPSSG